MASHGEAFSDGPLELSDRPLDKKKIAELQSIAAVMGLDTTLLKGPLLVAIQKHIKAHPEIADHPRLLPLFAHRTAPKAGGKTSAEKAVEDKIESAKPQQVATG